MNAIPTHYNGINFRSRLEAKWARFFDLIGWSYEYEPVDLNGYIPDFVLKFAIMPIYVEIKPSMTIDDLENDCQKSRLATLGKRLLCLGGACNMPSTFHRSFMGIQAVRLNLCDKDYADMEIRAFGKGNANHNEWDLEDKSTEISVIGYWQDTYLSRCPDCQKVFPDCWGYSTCPECGLVAAARCVPRDCVDQYLESRSDLRCRAESMWKQATNTTQYNRIFYVGKD